MRRPILAAVAALLPPLRDGGIAIPFAAGFGLCPLLPTRRFPAAIVPRSAPPPTTPLLAAPDDDPAAEVDDDDEAARTEEASLLKARLLKLAASYDRGFAATPGAFREAEDILTSLASVNPSRGRSADGIDGDGSGDVPLKAIWRMVWTSAFDVVSLGASPLAAPSAIYQDIRDPPVAINVIDFIPRAQSLFPSTFAPSSLLRAEVTTRASSRAGMPDRVGLIFEGLKLRPIELLGQKVDGLPPLEVDFTWPRKLLDGIADYVPGLENLGLGKGSENADALGYFDVEYLDDELLVIRQNAPGGAFALVRVDSCDP